MIRNVDIKTVYHLRHIAMYPDDASLVVVDGDDNANHLGFFVEDTCISVLSLFKVDNELQIRKFATHPQFQNSGYGTQLLNHVIKRYHTTLTLNARINKIPFYESFGFIKTASHFEKNGHHYCVMKKNPL